MAKNFTVVLCSVFFTVVSATLLHANQVVVNFLGSLEGTCGNYDAATNTCDGFGLGLKVGDPFNGRFSYDDSGAVTEFFVQFPTVRFDAINLELEFQPFDGFPP